MSETAASHTPIDRARIVPLAVNPVGPRTDRGAAFSARPGGTRDRLRSRCAASSSLGGRAAIAVAAVAILAAVASPANAWCRMTTSERRPTTAMPCVLPDPTTDPPEQFLAWQRPCTAVSISETSPSDDLSRAEVIQIVARSIASWQGVRCAGQPVGITIGILEAAATCDGPLFRNEGGNANVLLFTSDWASRDYDAAAFAVTTVWHRKSTGEILDVDMEVNERRGPYGVCPADGCANMLTVDLENVLTHEFGHYLGLAHSTEAEATMFASAVAGETLKRSLDDDDVAGLCAVYPPGSPAGACDNEPIGGLDLDCHEAGCGCSVPFDRRRRSAAWWVASALAVGLWIGRRRVRRRVRSREDAG